jgi:hypothetical protein
MEIEHLSRMINLYEDLLFGLTLFSDCMAAYYHDQPNIFTLNDNTFQKIKLEMAEAIDSARSLLEQAQTDNMGIAELKETGSSLRLTLDANERGFRSCFLP